MASAAAKRKIGAVLKGIEGRASPSSAESLDTLAPRDGGYVLLIATVAVVSMVAPLNSTMIAVALPNIRADFGVSHGQVAWLVSAYLIAMAVAQPLGGRLGDQVGRVKTLRFGLAAFFACSLAGALTPNFESLVAFRAGQALFGAAVIPNVLAMLRTSLPPHRLGEATGTFSSMAGLAAALGPLLGAGLVEAGSWRWLFLANLPLVGLALLSLMLLRYREAPGSQRLKLDFAGTLALAGLLTLFTLLVSADGMTAPGWALAGAGLAALAAMFVWQQARAPVPLADWRLFRVRSFAASTVTVLLTNLGMYTTALMLPFFAQEVQGRGAAAAGLLLATETILMAAASPLVGRLADARGRRLPSQLGGVLQAAGALLLVVVISADVSYALLAACVMVQGLGFSLALSPATAAAVESAPREHAGAAAGTSSMMRYLGSIVGVALLGGILSEGGAAPAVGTFRAVFALLLVSGVAAAFAASMIHRFVGQDATTRPAVEGALGERAGALKGG